MTETAFPPRVIDGTDTALEAMVRFLTLFTEAPFVLVVDVSSARVGKGPGERQDATITAHQDREGEHLEHCAALAIATSGC